MGCTHSKPDMVMHPMRTDGSSTVNLRPFSEEPPFSLDSEVEFVSRVPTQERSSLRHRSFRNSESALNAIAHGKEGVRAAGLTSDWDVSKIGKALRGNRTVKKLSVEVEFNQECGKKGVAELMSGIKGCATLEEVHLIGTGECGAKALGEFLLKENRRKSFSEPESSAKGRLKVVHLSNGSKITESAAKTLGRALRSATASGVRVLRLPSNEIGDAEVSCLAEELFLPKKRQSSVGLQGAEVRPTFTPKFGASAISPRNDSDFNWGDLPKKKRSSSLSRFEISGSRVTKRRSSSSLSLHLLDLSSNKITDEGCRVLAEALEAKAAIEAASKQKHLRSHRVLDALLLRNNRIRNIEPLTNLFFLKELRLGRNELGADVNNLYALNDLFRFGQLEILELEGNQIDEEGAEILAQGLRRATHLKQLLISHNPIKNAGAKIICEALPNTIEVLEMNACELDQDVAPVIAQLLQRMTQIRELSLSENAFGNDGLQMIALDGLKYNTYLQRLAFDFDHAGISDSEGIQALLQSIQYHRTIRYISLKGNPSVSGRYLERISRTIFALHSEKAQVLTALCSALEIQPGEEPTDSGQMVGFRARHNQSLLRMLPVEMLRLVAKTLYG